jgi:hypothetical protein
VGLVSPQSLALMRYFRCVIQIIGQNADKIKDSLAEQEQFLPRGVATTPFESLVLQSKEKVICKSAWDGCLP